MLYSQRLLLPFFAAAFCLALLVSCASPQALSGGPKDVTPPRIIAEASTPNKQVLFREREITITFDEWVVLKDVYKQLVISPLMPKDPDIKLKGKTLVLTLPDSLKEETTYSINFGNAITDLHEGNVLENYSFIFSTGSFLDSVGLTGSVTDAVTLKPAEGIWVMLHPVGDDSAVYTRKPFYLAKTNKEGKWAIQNIRQDSFHLVALKDENANFRYDQESELFGWHEPDIYTDESVAIPNILVFPREKKPVVQEVRHPVAGWLKLLIPGPLPKQVPSFAPPIDSSTMEWDGDTLQVWYNAHTNYTGEAILGLDSSRIRASTITTALQQKLKPWPMSTRLHPAEVFRFRTPVPVQQIDTSLLHIAADSTGRIRYDIVSDSTSKRIVGLRAAWRPLSRYMVQFLPGAMKDIWGRTNDSIRFGFAVTDAAQYGIYQWKVHRLDSTMQYVLLVKSGDKTVETHIIRDQADIAFSSQPLLPGKFTAEIIEDTNRNGSWDTGDYHFRRQPEKKKLFTPDPLRAGWDQEANLYWR